VGEELVIKAHKLVIQSAAGQANIRLGKTAHLLVGPHLREVSALNEGDHVRCITWKIAGELVAGPIFLQGSSAMPSQPSAPMDTVAPTSRGVKDGLSDPSRIYYTLPPVNVSDEPEWSTAPTMAADELGNVHLVWSTDSPEFTSFAYKTWNITNTWSLSETLPFTGTNPDIAVAADGTVHLVFNKHVGGLFGRWKVAYSVREAGGWSTPIYLSDNLTLPPGVLYVYGDHWAPAITLDADGARRT